MPEVRYVDPSGGHHEEQVENGFTLMEGAFNQQIPGMVAECGGTAACGTCHVYVDAAWLGRLPPVEDLEEGMLCMVEGRRENSRLACQIVMSESLDGIVLQIADNG